MEACLALSCDGGGAESKVQVKENNTPSPCLGPISQSAGGNQLLFACELGSVGFIGGILGSVF